MPFTRLVPILLLAAYTLGCGGEDAPIPVGQPTLPPPPSPITEQAFCSAKTLEPWSRKSLGVGGAVSFNEIMYHPAGDAQLEWIELYNPAGIDVDMSGFRLDGAVKYAFPSGTFIRARGFLIVAANAGLLAQVTDAPAAVGSYTGKLPDNGGIIELWNNAGRLLDSISYADVEPWPVIPDGSGASLAKLAPGTSSELAESWTASARVLGTPGAANLPEPQASTPVLPLVPKGATWRYNASGAAPGADWTSPSYDDSAWLSAPATFFATDEPAGSVTATATFTADNFFALYVGKADGSGLTLIGRDAVGDWTSAETFQLQAAPDDYVYIAAWEAPNSDGGPQSLIGQFALPGGATLATSPLTFDYVLGPKGASPGGALNDPAPTPAMIQSVVNAANLGASWATPEASADKTSPPWGPTIGGAFAAGTQFIWADTFNAVSASNTDNTYVLFRSKEPLIPAKGATEIDLGPTTTYFRQKFQVPGDVTIVQPWLDALVDDGAVFYLNGAEVFRVRMPAGAVNGATLASTAVGDATLSPGNLLQASALLPGENVLAVEVHQAAPDDTDMTFGASLSSSVSAKAEAGPPIGVVFNEVAGGGPQSFWLELANLGSTAMNVGGYVIASTNGAEHVLSPRELAPGELMKVDATELGFGAGADDKLFLYAPNRDAVVDGIRVLSVPRGRSAADPGSWRYPNEPTPGAPNVFIEHDEIVINEIMYHPPPVTAPDGSIVKSSLEWVELHNRSPKPVDVGGFQLVDAVRYEIPAGVMIPAGGYLVVTGDVAAMKAAYPALATAGGDTLVGDFKGNLADSGDNIVLLDACGNPVDAVHYRDGGRWPANADGGGSSLELRDPRADNAAAEAWSASDEAAASTWQTITYEGIAQPSSVGPDGLWHELVIGLLDKGEVLLDDVSVVEDPAGAATQLITDGTFESGATPSWRILGNHRHSAVIDDPTDPTNQVLRVVATGPTEHMHNHLETTLAKGQTIKNGATYRISLRAKWAGGSNQLNTRLYFNRLTKTTELALPLVHGTPGAPNSRAEVNLGPTYNDLHHAPVVPQPYEPVLVSVVAADPDGIADLTLWYAVDSGAAASVPMTMGSDGRFSGLIPGGPASSVYQLYITGKDDAGASSSFPALGPSSRALFKVDDGLAETKGLHNLRIVMTPDDASWLFDAKNLMSNDLVGATVIDDEREAFYDVGLRLKSSQRGRPEPARVGFALRFPPEQPFRGIHKTIMVDRSEGIGFGQRELLFLQAMNHAGSVTSHYDDLVKVLTPFPEHTGSAQLQLARFGDLLLDFQFENGGDGMLFEYELIYYPTTTDDGTPEGYKLPQPDLVVGTPIQDLGDDKEAYRLPFILKNNRWRDDYRGLIAFAKVFGLTGAEFDAKIDEVIDVDEWLRAFAFATLSGAVDNYGAGSQHNGDFYVRPSDGRVLYFPHDLDFYGGSPQSPVVASGDLAKLIAAPTRARAYYGHLYDIISSSYNGAYMSSWCDHLGELLPAQDFAGHLQFITARADWVLTSAPNAVMKAIPKVAFQINTNGGAPLSVATPAVTLDGVGWIDVDEVRRAQSKAPIPLTWLSQTAWQATLPVSCGSNSIELEAFDRHGAPVGGDTIEVTRTGDGCP
jgi:hypothetical protein